MKLLDCEKRGFVDCSGIFLHVAGKKWCGLGGYYSTKGTNEYIEIDSSNKILGFTINKSLDESINLPYSQEIMKELELEGKEDGESQLEYLKKVYGSKKISSIGKNLMHCSLVRKNERIDISPWERVRNGWDGLDEKYDITLKSDVIPELLGATVRYAFTRCRGKGLDIVTKALFPHGVPNSLDEYLESVDPDYKKWLIVG
ncbi:MAG: CdiI family contact-dependent growth inhibition immunity protein [Holosporales bacterium]|jgi:hypothetical protein|nr:CdiI family contact-dependent growth inhibition immunity protein [Holosporales bacterium]